MIGGVHYLIGLMWMRALINVVFKLGRKGSCSLEKGSICEDLQGCTARMSQTQVCRVQLHAGWCCSRSLWVMLDSRSEEGTACSAQGYPSSHAYAEAGVCR